jgi:hypothetical protein
MDNKKIPQRKRMAMKKNVVKKRGGGMIKKMRGGGMAKKK